VHGRHARELTVEFQLGARRVEHLERGIHDARADSVTGNQGDGLSHSLLQST